MSITAVFEIPGMSQDLYYQLLHELDGLGAGAPPGRSYHFMSMNPGGVQVMDVWDSEAQAMEFLEVLKPILTQQGLVPAPPTISPLVNIVAPQPQRTTGLTNAATVHRVHALFSTGSLDEVLELVAPEVQVDFVASGQLIRGRAGFRGLLSVFKSAFPDLVVRDRNEIASGDHVVVECDWTGTNLGRIYTLDRTIEPTGKRVEHGRFIEVYRMWNGRVVAMTNYQDPSGWMRELGIPGAASLAPIVEKHPIAAWIPVTRPDEHPSP